MEGKTRRIRLLLTGGGTGGHLFPAIAVAQEFCRQFPESEVLFIGTRKKVDTRSLEQYGFQCRTIVSHGIKGKSIPQLVKALFSLPLSCFSAYRIIRNFRPDIIFAVGGYVTGPVVLAGKSLGVPTLIHEQNSIPGMANRILGRLVDRVCLSLPGSGSCFASSKIVYTGNPVRQKIIDLASGRQTEGERKICLLVLGGSQGARAINDLLPRAMSLLDEELRQKVRLIHQTGAYDLDSVRTQYKEGGWEAVVEPFFTEMEQVYAQADLLVSRAGATTLAELAVLGKPAILIPYPYAADNHQLSNGQYYVDGGGALMFEQKELTPQLLSEKLLALLLDKEKVDLMTGAMLRLGVPDAANRIVKSCLNVLGGQKRSLG